MNRKQNKESAKVREVYDRLMKYNTSVLRIHNDVLNHDYNPSNYRYDYTELIRMVPVFQKLKSGISEFAYSGTCTWFIDRLVEHVEILSKCIFEAMVEYEATKEEENGN
jgi:hypothetical protein